MKIIYDNFFTPSTFNIIWASYRGLLELDPRGIGNPSPKIEFNLTRVTAKFIDFSIRKRRTAPERESKEDTYGEIVDEAYRRLDIGGL